jgi:hypothetical protein
MENVGDHEQCYVSKKGELLIWFLQTQKWAYG